METDSGKTRGLFDFISAITETHTDEFFDSLTEEELKSYRGSRYMINRFLSMNPNYLEVVNVAQMYPMMSDKMHYKFLSNMLPKKKQFNKYIKGAKSDKYTDWMVELVAKHFHVSKSEAKEYIELYYHMNKKGLRELCEKYGVDKKLLKQAKL